MTFDDRNPRNPLNVLALVCNGAQGVKLPVPHTGLVALPAIVIDEDRRWQWTTNPSTRQVHFRRVSDRRR